LGIIAAVVPECSVRRFVVTENGMCQVEWFCGQVESEAQTKAAARLGASRLYGDATPPTHPLSKKSHFVWGENWLKTREKQGSPSLSTQASLALMNFTANTPFL
jgi:hypothetical protein